MKASKEKLEVEEKQTEEGTQKTCNRWEKGKSEGHNWKKTSNRWDFIPPSQSLYII